MVYTPERKQLIDAAEQNDLKTLKFLVDEKQVPLSPAVAHIAAEKGYMDILRYVAKTRPSSLMTKDYYGNTLLHLGVDKGTMNLKTLKFLVEEKDVPLTKINDLQQTVARIAAKNGNLGIIMYIAEKKPFVLSKKDVTGKNALHMADEKKVMRLIKYLEKKYGDDIPQWNRFRFESDAIHAAVQLGHWKVLKYFLEKKKCDVDIINDKYEPPTFTALKFGHEDIFRYLVEKKNSNLTMLNVNSENILFITVNKNHLSAMKYVLDERKVHIDVDWKNNVGNTLLHEAVINNQSHILEYLVEQKHADVNVVGQRKRTPLHCAASRNNYEICKYLVKHGADPRAKDDEGLYPKSNTFHALLDPYLKDVRVTRTRRSLNPPNLIFNGLTTRLCPNENQPQRMNDGDIIFPGSAYSCQLPNILLILRLTLLGNAKSLTYSESERRYPLSAMAALHDRMDPTAIDVICNVRQI